MKDQRQYTGSSFVINANFSFIVFPLKTDLMEVLNLFWINYELDK